MRPVAERIKAAVNAGPDELWGLVRDPHPDVIGNTTLNRNLTEEMAVAVAKNKAAPSEALGFLASDVRFKDSYKLKLALCRNPKTPQKVAISMLKFIRIFDQGEISRDQHVPLIIRQKIEQSISEKIPGLPGGIKVALSRKANSNIVIRLMERGDKKVIDACLDSPTLTEAHIYKLINRPATRPHVIHAIARHQKWSLRYTLKFALIRNFHTPMECVLDFISSLKTADLQHLYTDAKLPKATRPFIHRELKSRNAGLEPAEEEVYSLSGDEDDYLSDADAFVEDDVSRTDE